MKRFDPSNDNAHILSTPAPTEGSKPNFDISKLLQILPKLNLNGFFNQNNQETPPAPTTYDREFMQTVDFMSEHNKSSAIHTLQDHVSTVQKLHNK